MNVPGKEEDSSTTNKDLNDTFARLSTPIVADASVRLGISSRAAPFGIRPTIQGTQIAGRVLPVRHYGSVDVFLEGMSLATEGDILVIDNDGKNDEGCIGDLTVLEARASGLIGVVLWGSHRDTKELERIGFPVFSYGSFPFGPRKLRFRPENIFVSARFGDFEVNSEDVVFADDDGVLFLPLKDVEKVMTAALQIWEVERAQAEELKKGRKLTEQLYFQEYLTRRSVDPSFTFRQHLRSIGRAIEE